VPVAELIGRHAELARIDELCAVAAGGQARFAVVTGEPGIGKTRLIGELAARAEERGFLVLDGRAAEFERALPFGLLLDAFDAYLSSLDARSAERLAGDGLDELTALFPSLGTGDGAGAAGIGERFATHRAVRQLLERLSTRQPVALLLDDVHWADSGSLEFLSFLMRRPPVGRVLVTAGYRTGQAPARLTAAIEAAVREGDAEALRLRQLSRAEAGDMLAEAAEPDRVYAASGGNPFYLESLARAPAGAIPDSVGAAIAAELDSHSTPARTLAEGGAVAGDPFEIGLAAAAAGVAEEEALASLDELVASGLVRPTTEPRRFQFRHPLVRGAVYEGCPPGKRVLAHGRAAEALAAQGAPALARASHVEASAQQGDADAIRLLGEAAAAALDPAPAEAAHWFEAALRLMPEHDPERGNTLAALGLALARAGQVDPSVRAMEGALATLPEDAADARAMMAMACVGIETALGRHSRAAARAERTLATVPAGSEFHVRLRAWVSVLEGMRGDFEGAYRQARALAADAAEQPPPAPLPAKVRTTLAAAATGVGRSEEALAEAEAGLAALEGHEPFDWDLDIFTMTAMVYLQQERWGEVRAVVRRGREIATALRSAYFVAPFGFIEGAAEYELGNLDRAEELLDVAIDAARIGGDDASLICALAPRAAVAHVRGDSHGALVAADEALELAGTLEPTWIATAAVHRVGALLAAGGEHERAIAAILEHCGGEQLARASKATQPHFLEVLSGCALALGRAADAERWAQRAERLAGEMGVGVVSARLARAALLRAAGDHGGAAALATEAVEDADRRGGLVDATRARLAAGAALAADGRAGEAAAQLEAADATAARIGAERMRLEAGRELRRLGRGGGSRRSAAPRGASAGGLAALSGRELEVAELVRDRCTNAEIAQRLFLSLKTVESHMGNIMRKLGVSSRVDVARLVEQEARSAKP
jgi:DNA-binding CsgD family transcriptional regulator